MYFNTAVCTQLCTLTFLVTTDSIVEIRDRQRTDGFDRYPFEEVEDQSFSVIVESEKIGGLINNYLISWQYILSNSHTAGPSRKKYAVLKPLDLICDSYPEQQLWCRAVCIKTCIH